MIVTQHFPLFFIIWKGVDCYFSMTERFSSALCHLMVCHCSPDPTAWPAWVLGQHKAAISQTAYLRLCLLSRRKLVVQKFYRESVSDHRAKYQEVELIREKKRGGWSRRPNRGLISHAWLLLELKTEANWKEKINEERKPPWLARDVNIQISRPHPIWGDVIKKHTCTFTSGHIGIRIDLPSHTK